MRPRSFTDVCRLTGKFWSYKGGLEIERKDLFEKMTMHVFFSSTKRKPRAEGGDFIEASLKESCSSMGVMIVRRYNNNLRRDVALCEREVVDAFGEVVDSNKEDSGSDDRKKIGLRFALIGIYHIEETLEKVNSVSSDLFHAI